jgi:hypothetical protein
MYSNGTEIQLVLPHEQINIDGKKFEDRDILMTLVLTNLNEAKAVKVVRKITTSTVVFTVSLVRD